MRLSDDEEEDEDPVLRGKRLWKQWQQSRMQQNDDDAGDGDEEGCSVAESLLQALSKGKKLKRYKPLSASLSIDESLGDGSLRSSSSVVAQGVAADAAASASASTMAPLVSAHIQQLTRTRCCLTRCVMCAFVYFLFRIFSPRCPPFLLVYTQQSVTFVQLRFIFQGVVGGGNVRHFSTSLPTRHTSHVTRHTSHVTRHTPLSTVSTAIRTATKGMYFERAAAPSSAADDGDSAAAMQAGGGEKARKFAKVTSRC